MRLQGEWAGRSTCWMSVFTAICVFSSPQTKGSLTEQGMKRGKGLIMCYRAVTAHMGNGALEGPSLTARAP